MFLTFHSITEAISVLFFLPHYNTESILPKTFPEFKSRFTFHLKYIFINFTLKRMHHSANTVHYALSNPIHSHTNTVSDPSLAYSKHKLE